MGKVEIPRSSDESDERIEKGRELIRAIYLNKIAFTELVLSIDEITSSGKIALRIIEIYKAKEFEDGKTASTWEKLKRKYDPVSASSLVKQTQCLDRES